MAKTAIMTDSNSGLRPQTYCGTDIHVVPMPLTIDSEVYYEGEDFTQEAFYQRLSVEGGMTTTQPAPCEVLEMWEQLLERCDEVVYLPMSSSLSTSYSTVRILAEDEKLSGRVHVVNNRRISLTQAQPVYDAVCLSQRGCDGSRIKHILESETRNAQRLSMDACTVRAGYEGAFFESACAKAAQGGPCPHADGYRKKEFYHKCLQAHYPDLEVLCAPLSLSVGVHTGPGAVGIGAVRACSDAAPARTADNFVYQFNFQGSLL